MKLGTLIDQNLSYTEKLVVGHIAKNHPTGGRVVVAHVTDQLGATRSVALTALRKLSMAGIVQTRSMGMKGTHIRVLQKPVWDALAQRYGKDEIEE